jgi:hypothetical protein
LLSSDQTEETCREGISFATNPTILKGQFPNDLAELKRDSVPGEHSSQNNGHFLFVDRIHRRLWVFEKNAEINEQKRRNEK